MSHTRTRRDWTVDAAMLACAVLGGVVSWTTTATPEWLAIPDIVFGTVAIALLWWRRERPVEVLLATTVLATVSISATGAVVVALFSMAVHRPPRPTIALFGLGVLTLPISTALHPSNDDSFLATIVLGLVFTAGVMAWGMFVRARRELVQSFRDRAERAEAAQQLRVDQARQAERARIAREMHDVLAHRISLLSMHAGALEFRPDAPPEEIERAAGVIRASAHAALEELREVIGVLRDTQGPDAIPEPPQPTALELPALVAESVAAGVRVTLHTEGVTWQRCPAPPAGVPIAWCRRG